MRSRLLLAPPAALLLAACSSTTAPEGGASSTVRPPPAATVAAAPSAPPVPTALPVTASTTARPSAVASTAPATSASPLDAYLGPGRALAAGVPDAATIERESRLHEEAIARCMVAEGFDYVPYVQPVSFVLAEQGAVQVVTGREAPSGERLSEDDYVARYGYGISTVDASATSAASGPTTPGDPAADPNTAIVDAMSVGERVAYYRALLGAEVSLTDDGRPNAEMPDDPASCWRQASHEVWGGEAPRPDELASAFASLLEQVAGLADDVLVDARMVDALDRWSACLAAAGFPGYTDVNAPQSDVAARARDLLGESMDAAQAEPAELAALRQFEIAVATADHACRVDYGATYAAVQLDVESRFVADHRAELEQYRDAAIAAAADG